MPKLPTRESLSPIRVHESPPIATIDSKVASVGRSQAQFGNALASLGSAFADFGGGLGEADAYNTERSFQEFKFEQDKAFDTALRGIEPGKASAFADEWTKSYTESARGFLATVPEKLKPVYDDKLFDAERGYYGTATNFERAEQKRSALNAVEDYKTRLDFSGNIDAIKQDYERNLQLNPYLTPIEKDEVRRKDFAVLESEHIRWRLDHGDSPDAIIRDIEGERSQEPTALYPGGQGPGDAGPAKGAPGTQSGASDAARAAEILEKHSDLRDLEPTDRAVVEGALEQAGLGKDALVRGDRADLVGALRAAADGTQGGRGVGTSAPALAILEQAPSRSERQAIFKSGGVVVNLDTNSGPVGKPTSPMVVIPDKATPEQRSAANAYAGAIAKLYKDEFGVELKPRVVTRSENGRGRPFTIHTEPYAVTDEKAVAYFDSDKGAEAHARILRETLGKIPGVRFSVPHDEAKGDRGAEHGSVNEVSLARRVLASLGSGARLPGAGDYGSGEPSLAQGPTPVSNGRGDQTLTSYAALGAGARLPGPEAQGETQDKPVRTAQAATGTLSDADRAPDSGLLRTDSERQSEREYAQDHPRQGSQYSGKYPNLSLDQRARLVDQVQTAKKTQLQERLWDLKQQAADDIASRRDSGLGRQDFEIDSYRKAVEPSVWNNYVLDRRQADMEYAAGRGLDDMDDGTMRRHLDGLVPEPGSADYEMRAKVYDKTKARADKLRELRSEDPAEAVNEAPEVKRVTQRLQSQGVEDPGSIVKARLEAQARLGIPEQDRLPITKAEATALLDLPAKRWAMDKKDYYDKLRAAADRAEETYGPLLAPSVFEAAVALDLKDKTGTDAAAGVLANLVKGQAVTADDFRRMNELSDIDRISRTFDATLRPDMGDEDRPYISPFHGADNMAFTTRYAAELAGTRPNAGQEAWIRDNAAEPGAIEKFDLKFGKGAAARAIGKGEKGKGKNSK